MGDNGSSQINWVSTGEKLELLLSDQTCRTKSPRGFERTT